jgi:hypothetical protein
VVGKVLVEFACIHFFNGQVLPVDRSAGADSQQSCHLHMELHRPLSHAAGTGAHPQIRSIQYSPATGTGDFFSVTYLTKAIHIKQRSMSWYEWSEAREQFADLANLTRKIDSTISAIIFLSFANNLYFICLQLLNGLS